MRRCDINNFGKRDYPLPPSCLISVYGLPGAEPSLHYSVPLVGVADPVAIRIHRSLRIPPTSSVNTLPAGNYKSCIVTLLYYLLVGPVAVVTATSPVQATRGGGNDNYVCTCCV